MAQIHNTAFNTLSAVDQWMKVIAGNVTGATVTGYRGTQVEFGEVLTQMSKGGARATDGYGSVNPIQRADSGVMVTGTKTDFTQGTVTTTGQATDLAIAGDAFFIVSRVPVPTSMDDLMFTRDGSFRLDFKSGPVAGTGQYRLVNKDGLFVMGYTSSADGTNRVFGQSSPEEGQGDGLGAFDGAISDGPTNAPLSVRLENIKLDHVRNPNAANNVTFDARGYLYVGGVAPRDVADNDANMQVGLAKFANAQGLERKGGGAYFAYDTVAGQIFSGTAGAAGAGRVVGSTNVLQAQAIEQSNTSINTTMPEITLAQKSFSAASKIISVGNTMIDDVNQLIR